MLPSRRDLSVDSRHAPVAHDEASPLQIGERLVAQASAQAPVALMRFFKDLSRHAAEYGAADNKLLPIAREEQISREALWS
jgi:hypothetical protein